MDCNTSSRRSLIHATHILHGGQCMLVRLLSLVVVMRWMDSSMTSLSYTTLIIGVLLIKSECVCVRMYVCVCTYRVYV